jgi:thioredoxin reductase (NADPH)
MSDTIITTVITILLISVTVIPYLRWFRKKEKKAKEKFQQMKITGLHEASMVHPHIDALQCIGCAACVRACPEGEVIGIIEGKATLIHGAKCIGHGLCAEACPVGAIELLMAKPGRSADLPIISEEFETTVKDIFIVGELGGLGIIKNAISQGSSVVRHIAALPHSTSDDIHDVAIIGAGPAGFAAGLTCIEQKLRYIVLEQNDIGGTVFQYPRAKVVMTSPVELPLWGKVKLTETRKEALLELWQKVMEKTGLHIHTGEKVTGIVRVKDHFSITSTGQSVRAKYIILALGRRGTPRKLGVKGEERHKVFYRLIDAVSYQNNHLLVVGGGDSAIEAAIGLASQKNNTVILSYRKSEFSRIKERNRVHIDDYMKRKKLTVIFDSDVKEILEEDVILQTIAGEKQVKNDFVFIFAGGELPGQFLKQIGVEMHQQQIQ